MEPNLCWMWKEAASGCSRNNRGNLKIYPSSAENEVSKPPCLSEKGGGGSNIKNSELSPFHCSCFPLVVFTFTGQPGCEGRLQGFGDREAERERMNGDWGPWRGLGSAVSTEGPQSRCRDWTTHRKQGSQDKSMRPGAWTRTIKDMQFRALDKLGRRKLRSWLHLFVCRLKWSANHKQCQLTVTWHVKCELHSVFILMISIKWY